MYVPPHHRFLRRFGLITGLHFAHFGLESGMVFEETAGVYERIYSSYQFRMNKKEREMCDFEVDFKKSFCWRSNPRRLATSQPHEFLNENGYRFQRPGLKTSVEIDIIWSEIGSWFGGLGSPPPPHKNSQEYPPPHSLHLFINTMRIVQITV